MLIVNHFFILLLVFFIHFFIQLIFIEFLIIFLKKFYFSILKIHSIHSIIISLFIFQNFLIIIILVLNY